MQLGDNYQWNGGRRMGGGPVMAPPVMAAPVMTAPVMAAPAMAEPVMASGRTVFNVGMFKCFGAILALLAAATLSLGIADVVLTMQAYCTPWMTGAKYWCTTTGEPYIWVWVASGIWGSVPIFLAGIFAMCLSSNPREWTRCFALLIFLSAIVFAPAMIVLNAIELWRGGAAQWTFYSMGNGTLGAGSIMPMNNPYQAKFAIPLVIAILAGIMFLMTGIVTLNLCCCMNHLGIYVDSVVAAPVVAPVIARGPIVREAPEQVVTNQVYYPQRPQIRNNYIINSQGDDDFDDPYSRFSALPYMPTRYNGVPNPYGSNVMFGNFASRTPQVNNFASDFFKPNPAYFWK